MSSTLLRWHVGLAAGVAGLLLACGGSKPAASAGATVDTTTAPEDTTPPRLFASPESASAAHLAAADKFDVPALKAILGGGRGGPVERGEPGPGRQPAN